MKIKELHEKLEFENMREMIEAVGDMYPTRTAISYRENPTDKEIRQVSYAQLRDDVRALASEFLSRGMKGKHCALIGRLSYPWVCTYYASLCAGAVLVPLDRDWQKDDLAQTVISANAEFLICDSDITNKAEAIKNTAGVQSVIYTDGENGERIFDLIASGRERFINDDNIYFSEDINSDTLSLLVFTSGTTGKGKGVMLTQRAILTDISNILPYIEYDESGEKAIGVLPPHHTYGSSVGILAPAFIGAEIYLSSGVRYLQKEMAEQKPTLMILVPIYLETFYRKILAGIKDKGKDEFFAKAVKTSNRLRRMGVDVRKKLFRSVTASFGGELRLVISGGAHISQEILDLFDSIGVTILNGYGITECAPVISFNHSKNIIAGSVGNPLSIDSVKIAEPNTDGEGEICVRGVNVMMGYYNDPEATADAFDMYGYFKTGDYGRIGKKGELYITGRKKNLIILSNGKNVYPEEIETELSSVPGVVDVIVYEGQSRRGVMHNAIVAEIYPDLEYMKKNGIEDIKEYFQNAVNEYNRSAVAYKKIGLVRIRSTEFPKNTLKKIMRFKLDMSID